MNRTLAHKNNVHHNWSRDLKSIQENFSWLFRFYILPPAIVLATLVSIYWFDSGAAQIEDAYIGLVRFYPLEEYGISNPFGFVFSQQENFFHILEITRNGFDRYGQLDSFALSPSAGKMGASQLPTNIIDPTNHTFDNKFNRLLTFHPDSGRLISVESGPGSKLDAKNFHQYDLLPFSLSKPRGLAVDPESGQLYILESEKLQIIRLTPDALGDYDNPDITRVNIDFDRPGVLSGLAFDINTGHFHVLNPIEKSLLEFDSEGKVVAIRDLSQFNLAYPSSIVFAPSADPTDDPALLNLYLLDNPSGQLASQDLNPINQAIESEVVQDGNPGQSNQIVELSFTPPSPLLLTVPTDIVTYVNTVDTSKYSPPSPDPSGLAYTFISGIDRLFMSDGEVEEVSIFAGVNAWETTLSGAVTNTYNLSTLNPLPLDITDEPTGVAWNPSTGNFFFTDDTTRQIYEIFPGSDGIYFTNDDVVTSFNTLSMGSDDPEGIAFDSTRGAGHLFVADGLGAEVYDINLGGNGHLDPSDTASHFDVSGFGINDPEGVEVNPWNDHLYILDRSTNKIAETMINGTLLRYLDIDIGMPTSKPINPAGLAYAPGSGGGMNLYIVDRAVDNNTDPKENDGLMYEVSIPNSPPIVDAGPNMSINYPNDAQLDGTVIDDGYPVPPGQVVTLWSEVSTPPGGKVTFGNASAIDTTASFSKPGSYLLQLDADDGQYVTTDMVTIDVTEAANQAPQVNAGPDQTITLPNNALLDGTVEDDGLPLPPNLVTTWSKVSGPGSVTFANASSVDTTASFSLPGDYNLLLEADDGEYLVFDSVNITVNSAAVEYIWLPILLSKP